MWFSILNIGKHIVPYAPFYTKLPRKMCKMVHKLVGKMCGGWQYLLRKMWNNCRISYEKCWINVSYI